MPVLDRVPGTAPATLNDLSPFVRFPSTGELAGSTTLVQVEARLPEVANYAAEVMLAQPERRIVELLPALALLDGVDVQLQLIAQRGRNILQRDRLTVWDQLREQTVRDLRELRQAGELTVLDILAGAVSVAAHTLIDPSLTDGSGTPDDNLDDRGGLREDSAEAMAAVGDLVHTLRLLASWAVREGRVTHMGSVLGVSDVSLPSDLADLVADLQAVSTAQLAYPYLAAADLSLLSTMLTEALPSDRQVVLRRRVLPIEPEALEPIGRDLGVTREAVRQNQRKVEARLTELLDDETYLPLRWRAATLAESLGAALPASSPLLDSAVRDAGLDSPDQAELLSLLLYLAGPYRVRDRWLVRTAAAAPSTRELIEAMGDKRSMSTAEVTDWLNQRELNPQVLPEWVASEPKLKLDDGLVLNWSGSAVEKAVTLLHLWQRPASADELMDAIGEGHNARGIRQRFFDDPRFMRVNRTDWVLRAWGGEEYTGIAEEIEQRIREWGGRAKLSDLIAELVEQFGVAPTSVRVYADAPKFVIEDGWVRMRTGEDTFDVRKTLPRIRGLYRRDAESWTFSFRVDGDVLRGSGRLCPEALAHAMDLRPGDEERTFYGPGGPLRVSWPVTSAFGPSLGSTRALALAAGAGIGDDLRIDFDLDIDEHDYAVRRIPADLPVQDRREALELLTGLELRDGELTDGVAAGIGVTTAEVVGVLRRRGDDRVADLLPLPADVGLADALSDLAALFDAGS